MGVVTFTEAITSLVPAPKLFKALAADAHNYVPKIVPHIIKSIEIIEGSGGPGSIKQLNFAEGSPIKYAKHKIDAVEKDDLIYVQTVIEGGELSDKIESVTHEAKFESSPDGGCIVNNTIKYTIKSGTELTEEEVKPAKESAIAVFKAVEAYLLANPDA